MDTLLPGIRAERMPTNRLTVNVLAIPDRTGPAVLFVHGNVSSSLFWQPMMLALPGSYRPLAIDLRGFGDTDERYGRIDAPGGPTWAPSARSPAGPGSRPGRPSPWWRRPGPC